MKKVPINKNFISPQLQVVSNNDDNTQLILMQAQSSDLYLLHQYLCSSPSSYKQLISLLQSQCTQTPYVLNPIMYLPIKFTNEKSQTSHLVQVLYQYGTHTLQQELNLRIKERNPFAEHQIWSILGSCVMALKHLKDNDFTHASMCMNDVFVTKDGNVKLCHPMVRTYDHLNSINTQANYIQRAIAQGYYFAPQQLISTFYQNFISSEQTFKSDIFSLAMMALSLCALQPINQSYLKQQSKYSKVIYQVDNQLLEEFFNVVGEIYSQDLTDVLFKMISYDLNHRISIQQLVQLITYVIETRSNSQVHQYYYENKSSIKQRQLTPQSYQKQCTPVNLSRVSQASQVSSMSRRKLTSNQLTNCIQADIQDKPSVYFVQCQNDYQLPQQNLNQSQLSESNITDQTLKFYISNQQSQLDNSQRQQLRLESRQSDVNRTGSQEHYFKKGFQQMQQVLSIQINSRNLGSIDDDSASIVVERHPIHHFIHQQQHIMHSQHKQGHIQHKKQPQQCNQRHEQHNKQNLSSFTNINYTLPQANNFKLYLEGIKVQNREYGDQQPKSHEIVHKNISKEQIKFYPSSARTYIQAPYSLPKIYFQHQQIQTQPNYLMKIPQQYPQKNQDLCISLNKNYSNYVKNQNPASLYTDPLFLRAMRQDVEKIKKKQKMTVTIGSARKEQQQQQQQQKQQEQYSNQHKNDNRNNQKNENEQDIKKDKYVVLGSSRNTYYQSSQSSQYRNIEPASAYTFINNMPQTYQLNMISKLR